MSMKLPPDVERKVLELSGTAISPLATEITEKAFQAEVTRLAKMLDWMVYHTHDSRKSAAGFPDLVLVRGKQVLAVELKVKRNRPTPEQYRWLRALGGSTITAAVWRPENWPGIQQILGSNQ